MECRLVLSSMGNLEISLWTQGYVKSNSMRPHNAQLLIRCVKQTKEKTQRNYWQWKDQMTLDEDINSTETNIHVSCSPIYHLNTHTLVLAVILLYRQLSIVTAFEFALVKIKNRRKRGNTMWEDKGNDDFHRSKETSYKMITWELRLKS